MLALVQLERPRSYGPRLFLVGRVLVSAGICVIALPERRGGGLRALPLKREITPRDGARSSATFAASGISSISRVDGNRAVARASRRDVCRAVAAGEIRRDLILFHPASVASPSPLPLPLILVYFSRRNKIPAITYACSRQERRTPRSARARNSDKSIRPGTQGARGIFALSRYHPVCFVEGSD